MVFGLVRVAEGAHLVVVAVATIGTFVDCDFDFIVCGFYFNSHFSLFFFVTQIAQISQKFLFVSIRGQLMAIRVNI